jgi:hypothetical protein
MWTRIDHVMICVPHLQKGIAQYRRLGFNVYPGGDHPGKGTHNAIALNNEDYIELLAISDPAEERAGAPWGADLDGFIAAGGGIRYVIIQSDDLAADVAAMRSRGVDVTDAIEGSRRTPGGEVNRWKAAFLGPKNPLPLFFIQHLTPMAERRRRLTGSDDRMTHHPSSITGSEPRITHHPSPISAVGHPNCVYSLERAYIVTRDVRAEAPKYENVLGIPAPEPHMGTVIMADMSVLQIGPTGLGIVTPVAPGPAKDALERRGPGPFQALYRTTSMGAAARWLQEHGMPPPARGTRNTGEQAMLVPPGEACGAYIGFVGPE